MSGDARVSRTSFVLQTWSEDGDEESPVEMRGKVLHPATGSAKYFREWATLHEFVEGVMRSADHSIQTRVSTHHGNP